MVREIGRDRWTETSRLATGNSLLPALISCQPLTVAGELQSDRDRGGRRRLPPKTSRDFGTLFRQSPQSPLRCRDFAVLLLTVVVPNQPPIAVAAWLGEKWKAGVLLQDLLITVFGGYSANLSVIPILRGVAGRFFSCVFFQSSAVAAHEKRQGIAIWMIGEGG